MISILITDSSLSIAGDFENGIAAYNRGDYSATFQIFLKEAQRGNENAQYKLTFMYANGQGVAKDYKEAVKWYKLAAEKGLAVAQYNLGLMYANDLGVQQDDKTAFKWFQLAAVQNDLKAKCGLV